MIRTQIQLDPKQARSIKRYAKREGISMAEAIRRLVSLALPEEESDIKSQYRQATKIIGEFSDNEGASDLATNHDLYLDEAYE